MRPSYIAVAITVISIIGLWGCESSDSPTPSVEYPAAIAADITPESLSLTVGENINVELPDGVVVKVGSYNIYGCKYATPEEIGAMLKDLDLDLIGLQEVHEEHFDALVAAVGYDHYMLDNHGVALLSKTSIDDAEAHILHQGRAVIHATTEINGAAISVYAAHISWNIAGNLEARQLAEELLATDTVARKVLMGDFNDEHFSSQINEIDAYMTDVYTAAGWYPGQRISWPAHVFDDSEGSQLIDLIFFGNSLPALVTHIDVLNLAPIMSDHKPVVAHLLFPRDDTPFASDPYAEYRDIYRDFPAEDQRPENLLTNPGAENGLTGWDVSGSPEAVGTRENQSPRNGDAMFTGFADGEGHQSSGSQTIDLTDKAADIDAGMAVVYIEGFTQSGYTMVSDDAETEFSNKPLPYDDGEIIVEALNADGATLARTTSARRDTLSWVPYVDTLALPPGTRSVRYIWMSHRKNQSGNSNDAMFDDLYLGYGNVDISSSLLTGNLLHNPDAETGDTANWEADGFDVLPDLEPYGFAIYAPWSYSGTALFFAGGLLEIQGGKDGLSTMGQTIDLTPYRKEIVAGAALRWGGKLRTWTANTTISMHLKILDGDGSLWGTLDAPAVHDPEWTARELLTVIPPGASAVRLVLESDVSEISTGAFADELFVHLERTP